MEPGLLAHPKFLSFERKIGPLALKYLLRLWTFGEYSMSGIFRGHAKDLRHAADYIEQVCEWRGKKGKLFEALLDPWTPEKAGEAANGDPIMQPGWIEVIDDDLVIHDFEKHNDYTFKVRDADFAAGQEDLLLSEGAGGY